MQIIKDVNTLNKQLNILKKEGKKIGFVPTMGALHLGHISLINKANTQNEVCVCSIFVNPAQFNNADDLKKYPKTIDADVLLLEQAQCDILFLPSVEEMYPPNELRIHYELGYVETILEGKYRAGHFQGVCIIVDKLLAAVMPTALYLGRKDYQQCMVIQKMMLDKPYQMPLVICDTIRENDGLAMSSRNKRLSNAERQQALSIITVLRKIENEKGKKDVKMVVADAIVFLQQQGFKVDYVAIADAVTLLPITEWAQNKKYVALVAAYLNEVRLIDNIIL